MVKEESARTNLRNNLVSIRTLLSRNPQTGMLPILQDIGRLQIDASERPDEEIPDMVERYQAIFASLRNMGVITQGIYEEYFAAARQVD